MLLKKKVKKIHFFSKKVWKIQKKVLYLYINNKKNKDKMKNLATMTAEEKKAHFAKIMSKVNKSQYVIEDVTPKGYEPEKN